MEPINKSVGEGRMHRTIQIGTCVSVQGLVVRQLDDGRVVIRVGEKTYEGVPVARREPVTA